MEATGFFFFDFDLTVFGGFRCNIKDWQHRIEVLRTGRKELKLHNIVTFLVLISTQGNY